MNTRKTTFGDEREVFNSDKNHLARNLMRLFRIEYREQISHIRHSCVLCSVRMKIEHSKSRRKYEKKREYSHYKTKLVPRSKDSTRVITLVHG